MLSCAPTGLGCSLSTVAAKISYTAPRALAARYRLSDDLTDRLAGMDALTDAVIKA